jgi:hypothetical protein
MDNRLTIFSPHGTFKDSEIIQNTVKKSVHFGVAGPSGAASFFEGGF